MIAQLHSFGMFFNSSVDVVERYVRLGSGKFAKRKIRLANQHLPLERTFFLTSSPATSAGIIVLYGYGVATYGLFHMLDYPVFVGLGVVFALSVSKNVTLLSPARRFALPRNVRPNVS